MKMPRFFPTKKWEPAPAAYVPAKYGSVFPPIQKLRDGRLVVDQCRSMADGSVSVAVFANADHPNAHRLPKQCPRAVRLLFSREWQLRFLRATDGWALSAEIDRALTAWQTFAAEAQKS